MIHTKRKLLGLGLARTAFGLLNAANKPQKDPY